MPAACPLQNDSLPPTTNAPGPVRFGRCRALSRSSRSVLQRWRTRQPAACSVAAAQTDAIGAPLEALTPHSGYHYDGRGGRFFEGWYFKVRPRGPSEADKTALRQAKGRAICAEQTGM